MTDSRVVVFPSYSQRGFAETGHASLLSNRKHRFSFVLFSSSFFFLTHPPRQKRPQLSLQTMDIAYHRTIQINVWICFTPHLCCYCHAFFNSFSLFFVLFVLLPFAYSLCKNVGLRAKLIFPCDAATHYAKVRRFDAWIRVILGLHD